MLTKFRFIILLIISLNVLIYWRAANTIEDIDQVFAECARNSGRTSAAINLVILFILGYFGLKTIYNEKDKKKIFRILISTFAINHLIHFFFVAQNFKSQLMIFNISDDIRGFITFILVLLMPIILWTYKKFNRILYFGILLHIFNVTYFISYTFYGRYKPEDPAYMHRAGIVVMIGAVILVLYRMFRERSISFTIHEK